MTVLRLALCVGGVYGCFLLWAIAQERLSVPFKSFDGHSEDKFKSPIFMGTCQSALSALTALIYLWLRAPSGQSWSNLLGLHPNPLPTRPATNGVTNGKANGHTNGHANGSGASTPVLSPSPSPAPRDDPTAYRRALLGRYLQCAVFITAAAPFGFAALSYISYPTMVLGKSCKLVPVMLMNVLLYRRKFAPHKYLVVAMVTVGITLFMAFGEEKPGKAKAKAAGATHPSLYANLIGTAYLLINLLIDGATNSTQDEVFSRYRVSGQQMMFWINLFSTVLTTALSVPPLPYIPVIHPSAGGTSELAGALRFVSDHPGIVKPLVQFALTGALGQIFIFETLQHFGSLTLVTITLTRKLFTMVLSVVIYNHRLTLGQWGGAAVVFAGISVEAWVKRKEVHAKRVIAEKEKAKIKSL